jgi:hypothetical protein
MAFGKKQLLYNPQVYNSNNFNRQTSQGKVADFLLLHGLPHYFSFCAYNVHAHIPFHAQIAETKTTVFLCPCCKHAHTWISERRFQDVIIMTRFRQA